MSSRLRCARTIDVEDRRDAFLVGAKARRALLPLIARQPQPASRVQLDLHLLDQRVDLFGPLAAQLRVAPIDGRERRVRRRAHRRGRRRPLARFNVVDVNAP